MHEALELKGGCAVVTGAAYGGIGFSIAHLLLTRYSKRCVLADVSKEGLAAANDALIKEGIKEEDFITHQFDCTNLDEVKALAQRAYTDFERVDFLVLNAGTSRPTKDYGGDIEDWKAIMDVNFWGVANGTQAFVENMVRSGARRPIKMITEEAHHYTGQARQSSRCRDYWIEARHHFSAWKSSL